MDKNNLHFVAVDDDEINLEILVTNLKMGGFENSEQFLDGTEAWAFMEANPDKVDILLLDKMMPRMGGLEVLRRMQEHPILKHVPVIIQTGDKGEDKVKECMDAGAFSCLIKQFTTQDMLSEVNAAVRELEIRRQNINPESE